MLKRIFESRPSWRGPTYGVRAGTGYDRNYITARGYALPLQGRGHLAGPEVTRRFRDVVFFASRDPNAPAQLLKWFRYGFLDRAQTLIVGKVLGRSALPAHIAAFEREGMNYLFYRYVRDLDLSGTRAVFYPYNTIHNPALVNQAGPQHIFLGHGDSDKAGSSHPMIRLYDRIFVSGQLSAERLLAARIVNPYDLVSDRVVRIGMPYLPAADDAQARNYVLYAPTWEGAEGQQYSSLQGGYGHDLVRSLLEHTRHDVVFRPHPSTGSRDSGYKTFVQDIVAAFSSSPRFRVHMDDFEQHALQKSAVRLAERCKFEQSLTGARCVITDVSSVISAAVDGVVPFAIVRERGQPEGQGLAAFAFVELLRGEKPSERLVSVLNSDAALEDSRERLREARERCVGVEDYLRGVSVPDMLQPILERYASGPLGRATELTVP